MSLPISSSERSENLMDWFQLHSRKVGWGAAIVVILAAGGWFYVQSRELRAERAERAYFEAQRSLMAGNLPLAESDLKKMIERYDGTKPAMGARLVLAQVLYDQGKFQEGVDILVARQSEIGRSREFGSSVHLVLAGGLEQLQKHKEAGAAYEAAAEAARFDPDRERYESLAAKAYLNGADTTRARDLWTKLGADSKGTVAGEARVRLGELDARPQQPAG